MKYGENSPEGNPFADLVEQRIKEHLEAKTAEERKRYEAFLQRLRKKGILKPGQSLEDYLGLVPSNPNINLDAPDELDKELGRAIDDLFHGVERVMDGEPWEDYFPPPKSDK